MWTPGAGPSLPVHRVSNHQEIASALQEISSPTVTIIEVRMTSLTDLSRKGFSAIQKSIPAPSARCQICQLASVLKDALCIYHLLKIDLDGHLKSSCLGLSRIEAGALPEVAILRSRSSLSAGNTKSNLEQSSGLPCLPFCVQTALNTMNLPSRPLVSGERVSSASFGKPALTHRSSRQTHQFTTPCKNNNFSASILCGVYMADPAYAPSSALH